MRNGATKAGTICLSASTVCLARSSSDGIDIVVAAHQLNEATHGKQVISDNPEFDSGWIGQLYFDAAIPCGFHVHDAAQLERLAAVLSRLTPDDAQSLQERVKRAFPHPHRAAADARRCAALFLAVAVPDQIEIILASA